MEEAPEKKDELFDDFDDFDRLEAESNAYEEVRGTAKKARKPFTPDRPSMLKREDDAHSGRPRGRCRPPKTSLW